MWNKIPETQTIINIANVYGGLLCSRYMLPVWDLQLDPPKGYMKEVLLLSPFLK